MTKRNKIGQFIRGNTYGFKRGNKPWNKGLKLGSNPEHSKRMSGKNHFNYGKQLSQKTKDKIRKTHLILGTIPPSQKGKKRSKKSCERNKIAQFKRFKENPMPETTKKKMSENRMGHSTSEKTKKKIGEANKISHKQLWQNPEYVKRMFKSFAIKPNKPETFLTNFLQKILPNEYKYVGDGQFILAGKCPDFMNINGQKKLIELWGNYWHRNDNPQDRINLFKEHGFDTLIIWESELKNNNLKSRILSFNSNL